MLAFHRRLVCTTFALGVFTNGLYECDHVLLPSRLRRVSFNNWTRKLFPDRPLMFPINSASEDCLEEVGEWITNITSVIEGVFIPDETCTYDDKNKMQKGDRYHHRASFSSNVSLHESLLSYHNITFSDTPFFSRRCYKVRNGRVGNCSWTPRNRN